MSEDEFKDKMKHALSIELSSKIERLPHIKDNGVFKVIKEINSMKIIDLIAPEFEIFKPHMLLELRFKVEIDFVYFSGDMKANNIAQQVSVSNETYGNCRYISEQEWFKFEYERVIF